MRSMSTKRYFVHAIEEEIEKNGTNQEGGLNVTEMYLPSQQKDKTQGESNQHWPRKIRLLYQLLIRSKSQNGYHPVFDKNGINTNI